MKSHKHDSSNRLVDTYNRLMDTIREAFENTDTSDLTLQKALNDPDGMVRTAAARALGTLSALAAEALPALAARLNDSEYEVRANAAWAIGMRGSDAVSVHRAIRA